MEIYDKYRNMIFSFIEINSISYKSLQEELINSIKQHQDSIKKLEKCLKIVENLKFKPGSIVVHKQFGNGLVLCPYIKEFIDFENQATPYEEIINKFESELGYVIQFVSYENGKFSFKKEIVKEEDLMPYTEASKILYGE